MRRTLFWALVVAGLLLLALGGVIATRMRAAFQGLGGTVPARA